MKAETIDDIRKQFHHEWLLLGVDEVDELTTTVVTGHLLAHSPSYDEIYQLAEKYPGQHLMTVYSEDWPEDLAAAFHVYF